MSPAKTKGHSLQHSSSGNPTTDFSHEPPVYASSIPRDNASLNLSVLQRHNPSVTAILSIAPYAVIYTFSSSSQTWEKSGCEGTLFVCRLTPTFDDDQEAGAEGAERYEVVVLNRRGLENFSFSLTSTDSIEVTDEYVLLQGDVPAIGGYETDGPANGQFDSRHTVYGVWIFAEPPPSSTAEMRTINARVMQECAAMAEASRLRIEEIRAARMRDMQSRNFAARNGSSTEAQPSLMDLFNRQRRMDGGWSVQSHGYNPPGPQVQSNQGPAIIQPLNAPQVSQNQSALLDLFKKAKNDYGSHG